MGRDTWLVGALSLTTIVLLAPFVVANQSPERNQVVLLVDQGPKDFTYTLDSVPVAFPELLRRMGEKRGYPNPAPRAIVILHENVTFSLADSLRGLFAASGFDWPRVFYFGKDKRLMVEVTYSDAIPFSAAGKLANGK